MTTTLGTRARRTLRRSREANDTEGLRGRSVGTTVHLPTGRAIVGGLLVAVSGLGIFAAHRSVTTPERTNWLVVQRAVDAGATITAEDLALAPMSLADDTRRRAVADPTAAIGRIALVPMSPGDLVLHSTMARSADGATTSGRRVGVSLDTADALGGALRSGDRVDVVAVPAADGESEVIVRGALVGSIVGAGSAGVGSVDDLRVILEVPDEAAARRVIDAHANRGITLIAASTISLGVPENVPETPTTPSEDTASEASASAASNR